MLSASFENFDEQTFDAKSQALEKFHNRDFSPAVDELKKMFPRSWAKIQVRSCPFIYSISRELANLYTVDPSREFVGVKNEQTDASIRRLYDAAKISDNMRYAHEVLVHSSSCGILILPDSEGRLSLHVLAPWRIKPERDSPLVTDERSIKKWRIKLPRKESLYGTIQEDDLILTPETIAWSDGTPLLNDSIENPIGPAIPLVILRSAPATGGRFLPNINEDLLSCQLALVCAYSDLGSIIHSQAWGQRVLKGGGMESTEVQVGPDTILALDEGQEFEVVSGDAQVKNYVDSVEAYLKVCLSQLKVDPSAMLSSGAYTAASRIVERSDRELERRMMIKELGRAENRIYRHLARWTNAIRQIAVYPVNGVNVAIDFHEFQAPFDPLHESQASQIRAETGLESIVEQIAKERGISRNEASLIFEENLAAQRKLREAAETIEPSPLEAVS